MYDVKFTTAYSKSNISHIVRGIEALDAGKGTEHELIEDEE